MKEVLCCALEISIGLVAELFYLFFFTFYRNLVVIKHDWFNIYSSALSFVSTCCNISMRHVINGERKLKTDIPVRTLIALDFKHCDITAIVAFYAINGFTELHITKGFSIFVVFDSAKFAIWLNFNLPEWLMRVWSHATLATTRSFFWFGLWNCFDNNALNCVVIYLLCEAFHIIHCWHLWEEVDLKLGFTVGGTISLKVKWEINAHLPWSRLESIKRFDQAILLSTVRN